MVWVCLMLNWPKNHIFSWTILNIINPNTHWRNQTNDLIVTIHTFIRFSFGNSVTNWKLFAKMYENCFQGTKSFWNSETFLYHIWFDAEFSFRILDELSHYSNDRQKYQYKKIHIFLCNVCRMLVIYIKFSLATDPIGG